MAELNDNNCYINGDELFFFMDWEDLERGSVVKLGGVRAAVLPALQLQVLILPVSACCST